MAIDIGDQVSIQQLGGRIPQPVPGGHTHEAARPHRLWHAVRGCLE
jgi:hypothetical protein